MSDHVSMLVLYDSPLDAPGLWVVREQRVYPGDPGVYPCGVAFTFRTLREAAVWILEKTHAWPLGRQPEDDPVIVFVWLL